MTQGNMTKGDIVTVKGTVERVYQPGQNGDTPTTPGSIVIKSEKLGDCKITVWQLFDSNKERTVEMPPFWYEIDPDWIIGKRVNVTCNFAKDWVNPKTGMVQHQYDKVLVVDYEDSPPTVPTQTTQAAQTAHVTPPTAAPTVGVAPVPYVDEREKKIIRQSCLKVAGSQHKREHFDTALEMRLQTRETAEWYLEWVITGENTPVAVGPEKQESLFEDSDNLQGEV